jgi:hypothetical protein
VGSVTANSFAHNKDRALTIFLDLFIEGVQGNSPWPQVAHLWPQTAQLVLNGTFQGLVVGGEDVCPHKKYNPKERAWKQSGSRRKFQSDKTDPRKGNEFGTHVRASATHGVQAVLAEEWEAKTRSVWWISALQN